MQEMTSPLCFFSIVLFYFLKAKRKTKYWPCDTYVMYILLTVHKFKGLHYVSCPEEVYLIVHF